MDEIFRNRPENQPPSIASSSRGFQSDSNASGSENVMQKNPLGSRNIEKTKTEDIQEKIELQKEFLGILREMCAKK